MLDSPGFAVFANVSSKLGLWLITREKNQLPLGDGSWLKKGGYKKEGDKQFLRKKSVHNSWIFFIKSDKKKRKQIKKVTKTLDFMRVWGMLTNLRKKIKWNHRKARAKKANR